MNRKLLNGLLVLTVAAGGVGTFTSCKDEDFRSQEIQLSSLQAQIDALRGITDQEFYDNLKELFDEWVKVVEGEPGEPGKDGVGKDGQDGKDALVLTLKPALLSVATGENGDVVAGIYTSTAQVYQGYEESADWTYEILADDLDGVNATIDGNVITVTNLTSAYGALTVQATKTVDGIPVALRNILVVQQSNSAVDLEDWLTSANSWTSLYSNPYGWTYQQFVEAGVKMMGYFTDIQMGNYDGEDIAAIVNGLYGMMYEHIFPEKSWFNKIMTSDVYVNNLIQRATSVSISQTINPVFGTINLPIGLNTMVLAGYDYSSKEGSYEFPAQAMTHMASGSPVNDDPNFDAVAWANILKAVAGTTSEALPEGVDFTKVSEASQFGNLGGAVLTINPYSVDFSDDSKYTVSLVNSKMEEVLDGVDEEGNAALSLSTYEGTLTWGASRGDNTGVYALKANATVGNFSKLLVDVEQSELKNAVKRAWEEKTLSNIADMGKKVFDVLNNKVDALAVKVAWNEEVPVLDADGNAVLVNIGSDFAPEWAAQTETVENYVLSDFDLAAVVAHPLSYNTIPADKSLSDHRLRKLSPLADYLDRINNKINLTFERPTYVDMVTLYIYVQDGVVYFFDSNDIDVENFNFEDNIDKILGTGTYTADGVNLTDEELSILANALISNYNNAIVYTDVVKSINDAVDSINNALDQFEGKVEDIKDIIQRIKDSDKLSYADRLIDLYNAVAERVNNFLAQPAHYLQVMAIYSASDGPHHLSTDYYAPTHFKYEAGKGFTVFATSYNGDVVIPSFQKWVGITQVNGQTVTDANAGQEYLNKVLPGRQQRVGVYFTSALEKYIGKTLTLTYVSVDYRGMCSMQNYYITIEK